MDTKTTPTTLSLEEKQTLSEIQSETHSIILELGEIELISIQLEERKQKTKQFLTELLIKEKEFTSSIFEKYGKSSIDPNTGEIIKID
jgi:hypothetical protein